ncbi:MAG TPA: tetratricopeptide repeat protein [Nitrospira sp.]|nr:tetratricopeptide repeat protein [Nitrospira sp.]
MPLEARTQAAALTAVIMARFRLVASFLFYGVTVCVPVEVMGDSAAGEGLYDSSSVLIVGIDQYLMAPRLPGAVEEAKLLAQVMRDLASGDVLELYNKDATSRRLQQVLTDLFAKKTRMGRVVVIFVGHTGVVRDSNGVEQSYLVPVDAQINNVFKSIPFDTVLDLARRSPSKHTLLIVDGSIRPWQTSVRSQKPATPDPEGRVVQVIAAADKGEKSLRTGAKSLFSEALVTGLSGSADLNQDGWLTASELGTYIKEQVGASSGGLQHVASLRIEGDGDTVMQHRKPARPVQETRQASRGREEAAVQYEQAVSLLQEGKYGEKALERLNRAIELDPSFGDAYVLKSYIRLEILPDLDEALAAGQQAVKYASDNPEAFSVLGQIQAKLEHYREAEEAFLHAVTLNPDNRELYFALGTLYGDHMGDEPKSVAAFRQYLRLGGTDAGARAAVSQADQSAATSTTP